jgi:hypothetical protein
MEILRLGIELILKLLGIFGVSKDEKEKAEEAIKKATSDYEKTADDSASVRQSHQETKSKLKEAWEKRWGNQNKKDQNT